MALETIVKIPPLKTGLEFLASSHFQIGNEPKWLSKSDGLAYKSTFKHDYVPFDSKKSQLAKIPPPACIMHKDDSIRGVCSVTRKQFVPKGLNERTQACNALTKTNFKLDKDDRIETFETIHNIYYKKPDSVQQNAFKKNFSQKMESHVPQGDREKEPWPKSDYQNNFHEKDFRKRQDIVNDTLSSSTTIKGDERSHESNDMFNTTSRKMFPIYETVNRINVSHSTKYPKTMIPCGDRNFFVSTQQDSYKDRLPTISGNFDRNKALQVLQKTSFRIGDNRLNCYKTTAGESFVRLNPTDAPEHVTSNIGRSSSENVCYKEIVFNNIGPTANMRDYKPYRNHKNVIVDGSQLRTVSKVNFGNDKRRFYETNFESSFPHKLTDVRLTKGDTSTSSIPLDYYENLLSNTSYRNNYLKNDAKKIVVNQDAIENMVNSHIGHPVKNLREFTTTNRDTYTKKKIQRIQDINTGRLQKSSVPIGTLCY